MSFAPRSVNDVSAPRAFIPALNALPNSHSANPRPDQPRHNQLEKEQNPARNTSGPANHQLYSNHSVLSSPPANNFFAGRLTPDHTRQRRDFDNELLPLLSRRAHAALFGLGKPQKLLRILNDSGFPNRWYRSNV
jgi:hypothetical protein